MFVYTTSTPGQSPKTVTTSGRYGFNAYGIQVRWRSTDFAAETIVSSPSSTIITSSLSSGHVSPSRLIPEGGATPHRSLTTGESVGIGIGITIGGLLIIALALYYLFFRRWWKGKLSPAIGPRELSAHREPPELWTQTPELDSGQNE